MNDVKSQIDRMKAMMTYGLKTEGKEKQYSGLEYQKIGADGKMYGIIREGTKYYIKVSEKTKNTIKEDFDYIGGFRNRKDHEYSSYANALKNFEMKMNSLNEAFDKKEPIIESWNLDKKEELAIESTDKMKKEIARQRQIMNNSVMIQEKKNYNVDLTEKECCRVDKECSNTQKDNIKKHSDGNGDPTGNGGDPFTKKVNSKQKDSQKNNVKKEFKPVTESDETLAWNDNEDYLDTTNGTEIGDNDPFTEKKCNCQKDCTMKENVSMHSTDNQNNPKIGVGEIGDDDPFNQTIKEDEISNDNVIDDIDSDDTDDLDYDTDADDLDYDTDADDLDSDDTDSNDLDYDTDADDLDDDTDDLDSNDLDSEKTNERLSAIEDMINKIAEKLGVDIFEDDKLYDDDLDSDDADDFDDDTDDDDTDDDTDDFDDDTDYDDTDDDTDDFDDDTDYDVYESKNYRKLMKEDNLDYFGKHPAYQKKVMSIDNSNHQEMEGYYDMNDETVKNNKPFGIEIGDGDPFEIDPEEIENAITESIKKILKKK